MGAALLMYSGDHGSWLNKNLRGGNETDLYVRMFSERVFDAMQEVGTLPPPTVYRGVGEQMISAADIGRVVTLEGFTSASRKLVEAVQFMGQDQKEGRQIFRIMLDPANTGARDISSIAAAPEEEEVLFPPNSQFLVEHISIIPGENIELIRLKEVTDTHKQMSLSCSIM